MTVHLQPFFLDTAAGPRFCLYAPSTRAVPLGGLLYVHPFAEEMNKTRSMVAEQVRRLSAQGWSVLQIDLAGCGDSAGDFGDATWALWLDDLSAAWQWLTHQLEHAPCWLWGTRLGGLLAAEFATQCQPEAVGLLLWQPVTSGAQHLKQFLRLRTVHGLLSQSADQPEQTSGTSGESVQSLLAELGRGSSLEVAGYQIAPDLAAGMQATELSKMKHIPLQVCCFEISMQSPASLSPAVLRIMEAWRQRGSGVQAQMVTGPAFWQTQEIEMCAELWPATIRALNDSALSPAVEVTQ